MLDRLENRNSEYQPQGGTSLESIAAEFLEALQSSMHSSKQTKGDELIKVLEDVLASLSSGSTSKRHAHDYSSTQEDKQADVNNDGSFPANPVANTTFSKSYDEGGGQGSSSPIKLSVDRSTNPAATSTASTAPVDKDVITDPGQVTGPKAGTGPNAIILKNSFDHPITLGQFVNGGSTTDPVASITLQPGQTGMLSHVDGEGGFIQKADSSGKFQPNASRLEYKTDADGKKSWPDVSYIDGRNAAVWFTDGKGLTKGDTRSIADGAPTNAVTRDGAGEKTIAGWYDGKTPTMVDGGAYMTGKLGTEEAYEHPADDQLAPGQNPMSGTDSKVISAIFAPP